MFFYRQGEITDEKERQNLQIQSQEVGDEYQKGLALCVLSGIFIVTGVVLFVFYAVYQNVQLSGTARSLKTGGELYWVKYKFVDVNTISSDWVCVL